MPAQRRTAFTLVELLVTLAIIATLLGLLLPAVQKVRAAANRIGCGNNLHQIGLGLHQYHDNRGSLPPGVTSRRLNEPFPRMSWLARLLPYIEQDALWRATQGAYDIQPSPFANPPHLGFGTPVKLFACPADSRVPGPQTTHLGRHPALTSYVGSLGTAYDRADGVLFVDSQVRLTDVSDGTSTTLMVGERPPSADYWYGWWYAGVGQRATGSGDMLLGTREQNVGGAYTSSCPVGPYHFVAGQMNVQCDLFHYWSLHPGGAHFLFADGSVRFLSYSADSVLPALGSRAGGEVADLP